MQARICVRQPLAAGSYLFRLALPSPDRIWPPFCCSCLARDVVSFFIYLCGASVHVRSRESPWRSRPCVFPDRGPWASLQPNKPGVCQQPLFFQDTLCIWYVDAWMCWCLRDTLVLSIQQRFADTMPAKSLLKIGQYSEIQWVLPLRRYILQFFFEFIRG